MRRLLLSLALALSPFQPAHASDPVTVFAASSLKTALDAVAERWQSETGLSVVVSYASSAALAKQIAAGAPADVFLSASIDWVDWLDTAGLLRAGTRVDLLGNRLVLAQHGREAEPMAIPPGFDLAGLLGDGKLAMALVDSVPAGQYGKAALLSLGIWDEVAPKIAQSDSVRAALALVSRNEAPFGIVYATDVIAEVAAGGNVGVAGTFPEASHPPIIYPGAVIAGSAHPAAEAFLDYLSSPAADEVFLAEGFIVLPTDG